MRNFKRNRYVYDTECYPTGVAFKFKNVEKPEEKHTFRMYHSANEKREINDFLALSHFLHAHVEWLIGFNNLEYDDLLLNLIMLEKDRFEKSPISTLVRECYELNEKIFAAQESEEFQWDQFKRYKNRDFFNSIDLLALFNPVDRVSLKHIAIMMRWPNIIDLPYEPGTYLTFEEFDKLDHYHDNDVEITYALLQRKMADVLNERIRATREYKLDVINACDTELAKKVLIDVLTKELKITEKELLKGRTDRPVVHLKDCIPSKCHFRNWKNIKLQERIEESKINVGVEYDTKDKQFEFIVPSKYLNHTIGVGGIHSINRPEIIEEDDMYDLWDIDAVSFYPYIIVNDKLYPKHLGPRFPTLYEEQIVIPRVQAKKAGNKLLANRMKITANSTFGLTKSPVSFLYDPLVATTICISGEIYLLMLIEWLEKISGCIVVYSNTDGVTVKVPKNEYSLFLTVCDQWCAYTGFELEHNRYKKMVMVDVNNYLMLTYDKYKPVKRKGTFEYEKELSKGYNFPIIAKALEAYFLKGTDPEEYIKASTDVYDFMRAEKTDVHKFIVAFRKKEDPMWQNAGALQKNNRWIITQGNSQEGKLYKVNRFNQKEQEEMQSGFFVTIMNEVTDIPISQLKLNYDFYILQVRGIIQQIEMKRISKTKKLKRIVSEQTHLFN